TVEAARLAGDDAYRAAVAEDSLRRLAEGRHVVVATGEARTGGPAPAAIAGATATLIADVASRARLARLAVFGGDTASLSSRALGIRHLTCLGTIGDGVVRCRAHAPDPRIDGLETIFKGGQMGPPDLLEHIVHGSPSG
ncbi:MAG TPA: nucleotide-binding domain containing protein, partial [Bauldia sp.]|nr:nucleotide-binding domain containing protein [Bauldia sp.]